jgi:ABC-type nickel/cobalt efflux system permease component RcnA
VAAPTALPPSLQGFVPGVLPTLEEIMAPALASSSGRLLLGLTPADVVEVMRSSGGEGPTRRRYTHIHTYTHAIRDTYSTYDGHKHTHTHTHTHTHMYTHIRMHTDDYSHTHTHTHTHTQGRRDGGVGAPGALRTQWINA